MVRIKVFRWDLLLEASSRFSPTKFFCYPSSSRPFFLMKKRTLIAANCCSLSTPASSLRCSPIKHPRPKKAYLNEPVHTANLESLFLFLFPSPWEREREREWEWEWKPLSNQLVFRILAGLQSSLDQVFARARE